MDHRAAPPVRQWMNNQTWRFGWLQCGGGVGLRHSGGQEVTVVYIGG
jgi:hypothetical protein